MALFPGPFYRVAYGIELVGASGFEPPTPRSRTECSTRLSHAPTTHQVYRKSARARNLSSARCPTADWLRPDGPSGRGVRATALAIVQSAERAVRRRSRRARESRTAP